MDKGRVYLHSFSQNSIRRSGNWHKVNFFRKPWFEKLWLEFLLFSLLSLNVDLLSGHPLLCCLSVDKSRDTVKNIFSSLTAIIWKWKMINKWSKWHLKSKHFFSLISKIYISRPTDIRTGSSDKISKQWSNWAFLRSSSKDGHVTHHFAAFLLLNIIRTFPLRKKSLGNRKSRNYWFFEFFPNDVIVTGNDQ